MCHKALNPINLNEYELLNADSSQDVTIGESLFLHLFGIEPTPPCKLCLQWEGETDRRGVDQFTPVAQTSTGIRSKEDSLRRPRKKKRKRQKRKTINVVLPTEVPPSVLPDFRFQDNDVTYLKDTIDITPIIAEGLDALMCVKPECTDHPRCQNLATEKDVSDVLANDAIKETKTKKVHFDEKDQENTYDQPLFPAVDSIGPPRLSSTFVDSSDDDLCDDDVFDTQNAAGIQNNDGAILSRDFECETAVNRWSRQNSDESTLGRAINSLRNNQFIASCGERARAWYHVIHDWANNGARSLVDGFINVGDSLNESFMNDTVDVSDTMKNISFYGDDSGSVHNVASILALKVAMDRMQSYVKNKNNSAEYDDMYFDDVMETSYHADGEYSDTDVDLGYGEHL
ncbi:hypothetical protein FSP39_002182 [Pinctada imbricata]|uniref:Uncharacterized protein n=1 Tax=Pinctada imbricata TaxID=66713 RepID=A0AA88YBJ9_PINIB|nr:hypothetical protein FSP39_002182 [Pinctada imbricata]